MSTPVGMRDVRELAAHAERVIERFRADAAPELAGAGAEVHHIGATSLPFGDTKGDVDVNIRVEAARFSELVATLSTRYEIAQPDNWTPGFASFTAPGYELPLGLQVTAMGSADDFLLGLRDRMRADEDLLRRYNALKVGAAPAGPTAYWEAKNAFLQHVLAGPAARPDTHA